MLKTFVTALLLFASTVYASSPAVTPAQPDPLSPWTVYTDTAPVRSAPQRDADQVTTLTKDMKVSGPLQIDKDTNDEWLAFNKDGKKLYVSRIYLTRPHPANIMEGNLPYGKEIVNRWWGIPISYEPSDLVDIPQKYSGDKDSYRLRKEACDQIVKMFEAAEKDGVIIRVASAYRSGPLQVSIYGRNTRRNPSQRSSAPPGHSEHQLGTTCDLCDGDHKHVINGSFEGTPESNWLEKHAVDYGYVRTYYPDNIDETGYITEPWHWRYFGKEAAAKKVAARKATHPATP